MDSNHNVRMNFPRFIQDIGDIKTVLKDNDLALCDAPRAQLGASQKLNFIIFLDCADSSPPATPGFLSTCR
jgi:hypothetical protein